MKKYKIEVTLSIKDKESTKFLHSFPEDVVYSKKQVTETIYRNLMLTEVGAEQRLGEGLKTCMAINVYKDKQEIFSRNFYYPMDREEMYVQI